MEAVFDRDSELFELADRLLAEIARSIIGREVKVTALIEGLRSFAFGRWLEVEELDVGGHVERQALVVGRLHVATEHLARIAIERRTVEAVNVAEHACFGGTGLTPRDQLEGVRVGHRQYVGFLDS